MAREVVTTELNTIHDFARLARDVAQTGKRYIVRDHGETLVVIAPPPARRPQAKTLTAAQRLAIESLAGAWEGAIDPDALKRELREAQWDDRAPIDL